MMASWGRHGWPRKDEGLRIYRERDGGYLLMDPEEGVRGNHDAVVNVYQGPQPSPASGTIARDYTYRTGCKRVQWSELPEEYQKSFMSWLPDGEKPEDIRGFWLVGNQPKQPTPLPLFDQLED
jgi:hypothetical protein